jgi:hypothetical protein
MMKGAVKAISVVVLVFVAGLYTAFVAMHFWDWFVSPAFHVSEIPFWITYGLVMFVGLFGTSGENLIEEQRWKLLMMAVDACIPEHRVERLHEEMKWETDSVGTTIFWTAFGRFFATTLAFFFGWVVHTFLA